ncbi:MAG: GxxExxY protein [Pyrinomonadaceae bacterium]
MAENKTNEAFRHAELTKTIIGVFYDVYNELGHGFVESVYENALCMAFREKGLEVHQQIAIPVWFRDKQIGDFAADVLVNKLVLLELKTARSIDEAHIAQLLNYLKATPIEVGLVLNFGPRPEFKRVVFGNERKTVGAKEPPSDDLLSASSVSSAV